MVHYKIDKASSLTLQSFFNDNRLIAQRNQAVIIIYKVNLSGRKRCRPHHYRNE